MSNKLNFGALLSYFIVFFCFENVGNDAIIEYDHPEGNPSTKHSTTHPGTILSYHLIPEVTSIPLATSIMTHIVAINIVFLRISIWTG